VAQDVKFPLIENKVEAFKNVLLSIN